MDINKIIKKKCIVIFKKYGVTKAAVFGSYARGEQKKNSDIDLLVELGENCTFFDFIGLQTELENILDKKVDLVTYGSLHHLLRDIILAEQKPIAL
jgi:uncharacterized protein